MKIIFDLAIRNSNNTQHTHTHLYKKNSIWFMVWQICLIPHEGEREGEGVKSI